MFSRNERSLAQSLGEAWDAAQGDADWQTTMRAELPRIALATAADHDLDLTRVLCAFPCGHGLPLTLARGWRRDHRSGANPLDADLRLAIADACAARFGAHGPDAAELATIRLDFLDAGTAVRAARRRPPGPFSTDKPDRVWKLRGKTGASTSAGAAHTRQATMLEMDGAKWRVKQIKYGPRAAANEVLNSRVIALSGIAAPETRLASQDGSPDRVASRMMPGFSDLGAFLVDRDKVRPLIEQEHGARGVQRFDDLLDAFEKATEELHRIEGELPPDPAHDHPLMHRIREQNARRLQARKEIFALLPPALRRETEKGQFLSRLIGDFDFLNFEGYNAGFMLPGLEVAVLDQGNAGIAGFKGGQKVAAQAQLAAGAAKVSDPFPPNRLLRGEYEFGARLAPSRTGAGAIARTIPVAAFLGDAIAADTGTAERDADGLASSRPGRVADAELPAFSGQMEAAYRLSLIPDEALRRVCAMYWPAPDSSAVPYPDSHSLRPTAGEYADTYIARRDALVKMFRPEEMARWAQRFPERARSAYAEVAAAVARETGLHIPPRVPVDGRPHEAPR